MTGIDPEEVDSIKRSAQAPVSLEKPVGDEEESEFEVGRTFNVTRERIRQIENQSLKKLQQLGEAQKLREVT